MATCKNCTRLFKNMEEETDNFGLVWCDKICGSPDVEEERDCMFYNAMTNGDIIRRMTDEELAEIVLCPCDINVVSYCEEDCDTCVIRWLKKEVDNNEVYRR